MHSVVFPGRENSDHLFQSQWEDVRYLTVAIINAISRDLIRCLSSWESELGFSTSERILEESQADTLVARVTDVFSEAVSN